MINEIKTFDERKKELIELGKKEGKISEFSKRSRINKR